MRIAMGLIATALLLPLKPAAAGGGNGPTVCEHPIELRFAPGSTATEVSGTVTREQVDCYGLTAREGQTLVLTMAPGSTSNATAIVFEPGWHLKQDDDVTYMDGAGLPGAGRGDAARHVRARLPVAGQYLIMAAPDRGGAASYTMRLSVR